MYFHTAAYIESLGQVANSDVEAVADEILQRRNSHLIFSEPFDLLAAMPFGTTLTRLRFANPSLIVRGPNHLWPITRSLTNVSRPHLQDFRDMPLRMPLNEEITLEATTDAIGPINTGAVLWFGKPQWRRTLPPNVDQLMVRATAVVAAGSETTWTALATLAFERDLFNGVYSVVGASVVAANARAFRLDFPSQRVVEGRKLRPGGLVEDAVGDFPWPAQHLGLGEWGRFHTFEPPSIQVLADAAGGTYEARLTVAYLGQDVGLLAA